MAMQKRIGTIFPAAQRPSTAVSGISDEHDDNIYSSLVLAHGGVGTQTIFLAGQGSAIPALTSTAILAASIPAHYQVYTPLTTMIQQSGQLGNSTGDASVRAIGVTIDQAAVSTLGVVRAWGATDYEVKDICSKVRLEVKISQKRRILGPLWTFPQLGGAAGYTTSTASSIVGNGALPSGRRLVSKFEIARSDTLTVDITADAALAFSDTSFAAAHAGQATLTWIMMICQVRSDVR